MAMKPQEQQFTNRFIINLLKEPGTLEWLLSSYQIDKHTALDYIAFALKEVDQNCDVIAELPLEQWIPPGEMMYNFGPLKVDLKQILREITPEEATEIVLNLAKGKFVPKLGWREFAIAIGHLVTKAKAAI